MDARQLRSNLLTNTEPTRHHWANPWLLKAGIAIPNEDGRQLGSNHTRTESQVNCSHWTKNLANIKQTQDGRPLARSQHLQNTKLKTWGSVCSAAWIEADTYPMSIQPLWKWPTAGTEPQTSGKLSKNQDGRPLGSIPPPPEYQAKSLNEYRRQLGTKQTPTQCRSNLSEDGQQQGWKCKLRGR